jgi:hypothetical protein
MSKSGMSQFLITFEYDARTSDADNGISLSAFDGICARVSRQSVLCDNPLTIKEEVEGCHKYSVW